MKADSKRKTVIFLCNVFILSFIIAFFLMSKEGLSNPYALHFLRLIMLMPAFSVIATQFVTRETFRIPWLSLNLRGNVGKYLLCYFIMQILISVGTVAFFCVFPDRFDVGLKSMAQVFFENYGRDADMGRLYTMMLIQLSFAFISGPFMDIIFSFCEMYGWYGFLFPKLCEFSSPLKASAISGFAWGIWYTPLVWMGYNYGLDYNGYPITGVCAIVAFCVLVGFIFSYYTYKIKSVFPAVIMRSALTAFSSAGVLFDVSISPNPFIGPAPTGILGGIGIIFFGVYCAVLLRKENKK